MKQRADEQGVLLPLRRATAPDPDDAPLAALFTQVGALGPMSEISALRVRRNLERAIAQPSTRVPRWLKTSVAAAGAILLLEAMAMAAVAAWPKVRGGQRSSAAAAIPGAPPPPFDLVAPPPILPPQAAPASTPEGGALGAHLAQAPARRPPRSGVRSVASQPPTLAPAPTSSTPDPEVALYSRALTELDGRHDPASAKRTLQAYRAQYPGGLFHNEASVAEVRADLLLGDRAQALTLLDALHAGNFMGVPREAELRLLRAELLGTTDRCDEALPALAPYLEGAVPSDQRERALYARALCRARLGDAAGSRADLRDYLREFPQGRFAKRTQDALAPPPGAE